MIHAMYDVKCKLTISQTDELSVRLQILRSGHGNELDGVFIAKLHVCPLAHRKDGLGCSHTVVRNEYLANDTVATTSLDVILNSLDGAAGGSLEGCGPKGGVGLGNGCGAKIIVLEEGTLDRAKDALLRGRDGLGCLGGCNK